MSDGAAFDAKSFLRTLACTGLAAVVLGLAASGVAPLAHDTHPPGNELECTTCSNQFPLPAATTVTYPSLEDAFAAVESLQAINDAVDQVAGATGITCPGCPGGGSGCDPYAAWLTLARR